jgi:hypothetical protein
MHHPNAPCTGFSGGIGMMHKTTNIGVPKSTREDFNLVSSIYVVCNSY